MIIPIPPLDIRKANARRSIDHDGMIGLAWSLEHNYEATLLVLAEAGVPILPSAIS